MEERHAGMVGPSTIAPAPGNGIARGEATLGDTAQNINHALDRCHRVLDALEGNPVSESKPEAPSGIGESLHAALGSAMALEQRLVRVAERIGSRI